MFFKTHINVHKRLQRNNFKSFRFKNNMKVLIDPQEVRHAIKHFPKADVVYPWLSEPIPGIPYLGNGILTANDEQWKRMRRPLDTEFANNNVVLNYTEPITEAVQHQLDTQFYHDEERIDLLSEMMSMTLNILCKTLFGHYVNSLESKDILDDVESIASEVTRFLIPSYRIVRNDCLYKDWLKSKILNIRQYQSSFMTKTVLNNEEFTPFMKKLIQSSDSEEEFIAQMVTFFTAGHETTAKSLTFTLWLLFQPENSHIIDDIDSDEVLNNLIRESLRLYPPAGGGLFRTDPETDTTCVIPIYSLQRHPYYWNDPDTFIIDRQFDNELYYPFSYGQRNCIGKHFAITEMRIIIRMFVKKYKLTALPKSISTVVKPVMEPENRIICWISESN